MPLRLTGEDRTSNRRSDHPEPIDLSMGHHVHFAVEHGSGRIGAARRPWNMAGCRSLTSRQPPKHPVPLSVAYGTAEFITLTNLAGSRIRLPSQSPGQQGAARVEGGPW
jgi:hypothetical protein